MTLDKSKKRGRPAQLLQIAELHAFVDYLSQKKDRSDLQNDVIAMLRAEKFNFDSLSEAKQILVKEALKLGFYISIAGPVTFKNSKNAPEIIVWPNNLILQ